MIFTRISIALVASVILTLCPGELANAEISTENCKLASSSGNISVNLGWPRNKHWLSGLGQKKFLVVGIDFSNAREPGTADQMVKGFELGKVVSFYDKASYGKFQLDFTVANEIINLPGPDNGIYDYQIATEIAKQISRSYKLSEYDGLLGVVTSASSYIASSAMPGFVISNETGSISSTTIVAGISPKVARWSSWMTVAHEIGHLLGFMDLWNRQDAQAWEGKTAAPFSLMNTGAGWTYAPDFYAWEKWLAGWIPDSDVICLSANEVEAQINLSALSNTNGKRLIVLPLSSTRVAAIEFRSKSELDAGLQKTGPLVYEVDFTKNQFELPISLHPSSQSLQKSFSADLQDWKRFVDAPLSPHEAIDIGSFRVANLADLSENNLLISNQNLSEIDQKIDALIKSKTAIDTAARDSKAKKEEEAKALANKLAPDKQSANNKNSPKKLTITCVKGKSIKKFTKVKPSCPAGYKKK